MAARKDQKDIIRHVDSYESYIKNPKKYHSLGVIEFIKTINDVEQVKAVLEADSRKSVQTAANYKLSSESVGMDALLALSEYYKGDLSKDKLKKALKSDAKYVDLIIKRYKESRIRNASLKRRERPLIQPKKRFHNIPWTGKIRLTKQMFVSAYVNQIIERGIVK